MTDPDADARRLATLALAAGEATGWFEPLYASAAEGDAVVPWDRDAPNALLVEWASSTGLRGDGRSALVVGCGYGRDAEYLASLGFAVTAFDLSPTAIAGARKRHPSSSVRYVTADLLALPDDWRGAYEFVLESHNVQALPDPPRSTAIAAVRSTVTPGGMLVVLMFGRADDEPERDGPPWPLSRREIESFAGNDVRVESIDPVSGDDGGLRWRAVYRRDAKPAWLPDATAVVARQVRAQPLPPSAELDELDRLAEWNRRIHDVECVNLNPATNVMSPRAEALLAAGLGSRPSLGHPGDKYEMGLEAIEQIEIRAADLACRVFAARYAEVRVGSGALANLYAFLATCRPGDTIIAPPPEIGGHVTHHRAGAAGLFGITTVPAPVDPLRYTVDVSALRALARDLRPKLITIGGSLNLFPHPVADVRAIADEVGASVLFDAAHLCGVIAGGAWPNPLRDGAHVMTMSTYKSLGGPAGGLVLTNNDVLAERIDAIAYPGLTANFDAGKTAALAATLLDWTVAGKPYAAAMIATAHRLADELVACDVPAFAAGAGATQSHQFAVRAQRYGGGQTVSRLLRRSNLLACGIGLPDDPVAGDVNGLRLGTPEIVRRGMTENDMPVLARFLARALGGEVVAAEVSEWRRQFQGVHYTVESCPQPT